MKERPILFSAPMVRALLDGSKTQTRRVAMHTVCGVRVPRFATDGAPEVSTCPYGVPGDRLWVRESAWLYGQWWKDGFTKSGRQRWTFAMSFGQKVRYERPLDHELTYQGSEYPGYAFRPSIHLPRWASRLTLEITDVRVERLQDISEDDARAEGCALPPSVNEQASRTLHRVEYFKLWESLNAARGYGWDANPWVWVVSFNRAAEVSGGHAAPV